MMKIKKKTNTKDMSLWDQDFLKVDQGILFQLILVGIFHSHAANYLDIKGLLDVTCKTVANMIKGKVLEEIRRTFNIKNDFTYSRGLIFFNILLKLLSLFFLRKTNQKRKRMM